MNNDVLRQRFRFAYRLARLDGYGRIRAALYAFRLVHETRER